MYFRIINVKKDVKILESNFLVFVNSTLKSSLYKSVSTDEIWSHCAYVIAAVAIVCIKISENNFRRVNELSSTFKHIETVWKQKHSLLCMIYKIRMYSAILINWHKMSVKLRMTFWCLQFSKKNNANIWWISALELKKWLNQINKGPFSC